jgi:hypothetical protein
LRVNYLLYNGRIHTQSDGVIVDSVAVSKSHIAAVGNNLEHDPEFKKFYPVDLQGKTVVPGLNDAHTHFGFLALSLGRVSLEGLKSIDACLRKLKKHAETLKRDDWVLGAGFSTESFSKRVIPDRHMLDKVTGGRPAFVLSKDEHTAWVNTRALEMAGIHADTPQPSGGEYVKDAGGEPTGILREGPAWQQVAHLVPQPSATAMRRLYDQALQLAWSRGVTGVTSFDSPEVFEFFTDLAERNKLGIRIDYYPPAGMLPTLKQAGIRYGAGNEWLRICGVKIFADGALGSQTALCFNKYKGSKSNYGIEVTPPAEMSRMVKSAARLGLPAAIHAIGDRAVAQVLDVLEEAPALKAGQRHRIEHLQLIRRKDIPRVRKLGVVASMQPSHCPSDIDMIERYWGQRGRNAYIFRTLIDKGVDMAFGSDAPIEPLDPLAGIAAAVRRAPEGKRKAFYPEQRVTASEALQRFTVGPAMAVGQDHVRGRILPGYLADLTVLADDPTRIAATKLYDLKVVATIVDGRIKYGQKNLNM